MVTSGLYGLFDDSYQFLRSAQPCMTAKVERRQCVAEWLMLSNVCHVVSRRSRDRRGDIRIRLKRK